MIGIPASCCPEHGICIVRASIMRSMESRLIPSSMRGCTKLNWNLMYWTNEIPLTTTITIARETFKLLCSLWLWCTHRVYLYRWKILYWLCRVPESSNFLENYRQHEHAGYKPFNSCCRVFCRICYASECQSLIQNSGSERPFIAIIDWSQAKDC